MVRVTLRRTCATRWPVAVQASIVLGAGFSLAGLFLAEGSGPAVAMMSMDNGGGDPVGTDRAFIEQYLGAGVLGAAVAAETIVDPRAWLPPSGVQLSYQLVGPRDDAVDPQQGPNGLYEVEVLEPVQGPPGSNDTRWSRRVGNRAVMWLDLTPDSGITVVTSLDPKNAVISRYSPGEALLPPGFAPGQSVQRTIQVAVSDVSTPDQVHYRGSLQQTLTYVGAFEVTVPAGVFTGILLDQRFKGTVGPANIDDHQCVILAKGMGTIAAIESKHISAMLFFNEDDRHGRLLQSSMPLSAPSESGAGSAFGDTGGGVSPSGNNSGNN